MMKSTVVYALERPPATFAKAIFLAGPTPRDPEVLSWRPEALRLLEKMDYDGVIFVPEHRSGKWHGDWEAQADWEDTHLNMADSILFWVPRSMEKMPGLTTNVEFGRWERSGRIVFGGPEDAVKNRYLQYYAEKLGMPTAKTLKETLTLALNMTDAGAPRTGGEREVPLHIWNTAAFQRWYAALKGAGNRLEHAKQVWTFHVGPKKEFVFFSVLHVDIYVAAEDRYKTNEVVLARPDISTIVLYQRATKLDDSTVVLIREFRSAATSSDGYTHELPGGSSLKLGGNPLQLAADELREETGLSINASRFVAHESRQMLATLSAHHAHLFSVEITNAELAKLHKQVGVALGVVEDTERTYIEVTTLGDIRKSDMVDWSMLGMILEVIAH